MPGGDQAIGGLAIAREALHLEERSLVPIDAEPLQAVDDRRHRSLGRALQIGVLHAQNELPAVMPRVGPGEERRARASYMQITGGTGREAGADCHQIDSIRGQSPN